MTLQELTEMEDEKLVLLACEFIGWKYMKRIADTAIFLFPPNPKVWSNRACKWTEQVVGEFEVCDKPSWHTGYAKKEPQFTTDLNACSQLETLLLSQPQPAKMAPGEPATPRQRYEFALLQLEPEKPLWAKSARTKTISFIYSQQ